MFDSLGDLTTMGASLNRHACATNRPSQYGRAGATHASVSAFTASCRPEQISDAPAVETTGRDHPIIDADPTISPSNRDAGQPSSSHEPRQAIAVGTARRTAEFRGVEVRQSHFNPSRWIDARPDAQTVAIPHISNDPGECLSSARR